MHELNELQARLGQKYPIKAWVTHCSPIGIWSRETNFSNETSSLQRQFISNGGKLARIFVDTEGGRDSKYRHIIGEMKLDDIDVSYFNASDSTCPIPESNFQSDFLIVEKPDSQFAHHGYMTMQWIFSDDKKRIEHSNLTNCGTTYNTLFDRWEKLFREAIRQAQNPENDKSLYVFPVLDTELRGSLSPSTQRILAELKEGKLA